MSKLNKSNMHNDPNMLNDLATAVMDVLRVYTQLTNLANQTN